MSSTELLQSRISELEAENNGLRDRIVSLETELSTSSSSYKKREILAETVGTQTEEECLASISEKAKKKKNRGEEVWRPKGASLADEVREAAEAVTLDQGRN
ncbi:Hypothetical protein FKW44_002142 [Caligus rogercresseyi]|uniref:Uncharacterized protein n=1 Tax=Caligus rogercresseyi TaxID=217165 RepID=A0A7T8KJS4_CALRO|nr:Hypothetical protein FKW44_002142 [Caligus rogercresseyi]